MSHAPGQPLSPEGRTTTAERLMLEELQGIRGAVERLVTALTLAQGPAAPAGPPKGLSPAIRQHQGEASAQLTRGKR